MKKNAFTFVELLASILLIMILTLLVFFSITAINDDTRKKTCKSKIKMILSASEEWGENNLNDLSEVCTYVYVRDLIAEGFLTGDAENKTILKNPITNGSMNNVRACVTYTYVNNRFVLNAIMEDDICG
jgi:competence protein ComGC